MPARVRLTRRFPAAMTDAGYRRLRAAAERLEVSEGELMSFVFENFDALMDEEVLTHRLPPFKAACGGRKTQ